MPENREFWPKLVEISREYSNLTPGNPLNDDIFIIKKIHKEMGNIIKRFDVGFNIKNLATLEEMNEVMKCRLETIKGKLEEFKKGKIK